MQLIRLELGNYVAYRSASIDLATNGMTLIVGPNNAGKSALLSAVDALLVQPNSSRVHSGANRAEVAARFALTEAERLAWIESAGRGPNTDAWIRSDALRLVEWGLVQVPDNRLLFVELRASDAHGNLHALLTKKDSNPVASNYRICPFPGWMVGHGPEDAFVTTNRVSGGPAEGPFWSRTPGFELLDEWLKTWRQSAYHFGPLRAGTQRSREIDAVPKLTPSGENLPEVLLWHRNNQQPTFEQISATISRLVPEVGDLRTVVERNRVEIAFADATGQPRNLKDLGTGVEQLLMTAVVGITQPTPSLMLLEEPETALHPEAQRWLMTFLEEWSAERQFVMSTHSGIFVDRAPENASKVWLVERRGGVSTVEPADNAPAAVLDALGVRLSDVLSARGLLLVEGPSDREVLLRWFGERLLNARIVVVESGGGDAAWDVEQLALWIDAANRLPQPCLFIRDRDEMDQRSVRSLAASGRVKVLAKRELENYLMQPSAIRSALSASAGDPSSLPDETEITGLLRDTADRLKPTVLLKRVAYRLGRYRPVSRADIKRLVKRPSLESLKALVAANTSPLRDLNAVWAEEAARLDRQWERNRLSVAPGEEILTAVWASAGLSFSKARDCALLAEAVNPPAEIEDAVESLIAAVET